MKRHHYVVMFLVLVIGTTRNPSPLLGQTPDTTGLGALLRLDSLREADSEIYDQFRTLMVTSGQMALGRLGFGQLGYSGVMDSSTAATVRRFEAARGLAVSGDLFNPATFGKLMHDAERVTEEEQRPSLGRKNFSWGGSFLMAGGPWVMDHEPDTYEAVDILCNQNARDYYGASSTLGECRLFWARLGRGFMTSNQLTVESEHFAVARWDDAEIVSRPVDYQCTRYMLTINRLQESVVMTRSTISREPDCDGVMVGDFVTRLSGSNSYTQEIRDVGELTQQALGLYNLGPEARAAFGIKPL